VLIQRNSASTTTERLQTTSEIAGGGWTMPDNFFKSNTTITVACKPGFTGSRPTWSLTCSKGSWEDATQPKVGNVIGVVQDPKTSTGNQACRDSSYAATDASDSYCSAYGGYPHLCGTLDDDDFTAKQMCCACGGGLKALVASELCRRPTCSTPAVDFGAWLVHQAEGNQTFQLLCNSGYKPANGPAHLTCMEDGVFESFARCIPAGNAGSWRTGNIVWPGIVDLFLLAGFATALYVFYGWYLRSKHGSMGNQQESRPIMPAEHEME